MLPSLRSLSSSCVRHSLTCTLQRLIFLFFLFHVCIRVDAARLAKEQAAKEKRAREEAERRRRREAEARAEQDRREVEAKEQEAAAYADLQRGRAVVGKPIRVQREGGAGLPIGWQEVVDAASGNTYYFHAGTNASQWGRPGCIGRVTEFNEYEGKHKVAYTDGESKWLFLTEYSEVSEAEMQAEVAAIRGE